MPTDKSLESTSKMMAEYISVGEIGSNETHGKCVYSTLARRIEKERKPTSPTLYILDYLPHANMLNNNVQLTTSLI